MSHFKNRSGRYAVLFVALLAAAGTVWAYLPSAEDGYWVASGSSDCPSNRICADWFTAEGHRSAYSCCIPSYHLGGSYLGACAVSFRHGGHR